MKRAPAFTVIAALLLVGVRGDAPAKAPRPLPPAKPALWKLSDADTTIWLFGTVHVLPKALKWRTPVLDKAMAESQELVLEVGDLADSTKQAGAFVKLAMSPNLPPAAERVPADKRDALNRLVKQSGVPIAFLDQLETWAVGITLAAGMLRDLKLSPDDGVEQQLMKIFGARKVPVSGLETTEQQLSFFDTLSERAQRTFLTSMVDESVSPAEEFDKMIAAWSRGDEKAIAISFDDELQLSPELIDALLRKRNANWTQWIGERMKKPGTVFVAVGAGHLAGPDSVQKMLAQRGLKTKRVQ